MSTFPIYLEHLEELSSRFPNHKNWVIFGSFSHLYWRRSDYQTFVESLLINYPEKNLFFPGFTYSSRREEEFHPLDKPDAQNGALSRVVFEILKNDSKFERTYDEDFSYLYYSQNQKLNSELTKRKIKSFGSDSHHEGIFNLNPLMISMFNGLNDGFTPAMHVEALANVPYRKFIELRTNLGVKMYYARVESLERNKSKVNRNRIKNFMEDNERYINSNKNSLDFFAVEATYFQLKALEKLKFNENYFIND